jgi:hypothetical protein
MTHPYLFSTRFFKNSRYCLAGTAPAFSGLFIICITSVRRVCVIFIVHFQLIYIEILSFRNGKESAHE